MSYCSKNNEFTRVVKFMCCEHCRPPFERVGGKMCEYDVDVEYYWCKTCYPLTIVKDRYSGCYSGGEYLAFPYDYYELEKYATGIEDGDFECREFWQNYTGYVGKGATPNEALEDLKKNMMQKAMAN